jgi:predicted ATPase/DNA-binding SARP family transcriptional activator
MLAAESRLPTHPRMPPVLHLLGVPDIERDGARYPLAAERRHQVVAYLAYRGDWVAREQLAALFYADRSNEAARSNLRKLLLKVRALDWLGDALESDGNSMRLRVETDVQALLAAQAARDAPRIVALYRGPLLAGIDAGDAPGFTEWLDFERRRLHNLWRDAALDVLERAPPPADALALCARLLDADPLDETALRARLHALVRSGQTAQVERAYREFAQRLKTELGLEPSVETRRLCELPAAAAPASAPEPVATASGGATAVAATAPDAAAATTRVAAPGAPAPAVTPPAALPATAPAGGGFVGRVTEQQQIAALLAQDDCRIVTVLGPGGSGKSRLVQTALPSLAGAFRDGGGWIGLDDLVDMGQVLARIAERVGAKLGAAGDAGAQLAQQLKDRHLLLALDNCEHLPQLGQLAARLVQDCPRLKLLVTSRARLSCPGEWLLPLEGLPVPDEDETDVGVLRAFDAVKLFEQRARAEARDFDLARQAGAVVELTRLVDGLPLALELAAAWVRLLPVRDIVRELRTSIDLLEAHSANGAAGSRERSMRASFAHSWQLLAPSERRALAALSVFAGGFTHEAAQQVAETRLPVLASLAGKSLLRAHGDGRFSLHVLIRQCAAEQLALDPAQADAAHDRHLDYYRRLMEPFATFVEVDDAAALRVIGAELPNLLVAWNRAVDRRDFAFLQTCAPGLGVYYQMRGPIGDALPLFARAEAAIEAATPVDLDAQWHIALERGSIHYWLGQHALMEEAARKALKAARAAGNAFAIRSSLNTVGLALARQGSYADADRFVRDALKRARAKNVRAEIPYYAGNLASIRQAIGDHDAVMQLGREALAGYRANKQFIGVAATMGYLGACCLDQGRTAEAIDWLSQALQVATEQSLASPRVRYLAQLAEAHLEAGDLASAARHCEQSLQALVATGDRFDESYCHRLRSEIALALGDEPTARSWLRSAVAAARESGVTRIVPVVRTGALFFEKRGDLRDAMRLLAWTARQKAPAAPPRVAAAAGRIRARLTAAEVQAAEDAGAALTTAELLQELNLRLDAA